VSEISYQLLRELSVISENDNPEIHSIYESAVQNLDLTGIDYCTIRDLVKLSGRNDPSLHLMLIAMFASLGEGSVCLKLDPESLSRKLKPIAGTKTETSVQSILKDVKKYAELIHVNNDASPQLFTDPRDEYKPLILAGDGDSSYLYFQKYYVAERSLRKRLSAVMERNVPLAKDPDAVKEIIHTVLEEKPVFINRVKAILNEEQKLGVTLPLHENFVLISGGPGTGKTFIVLNLVRVLVRMGVPVQRIKIAAPTGRAAQKLTEAIQRGIASLSGRDSPDRELAGLKGTTIHRLLEYSPSRNDFAHNKYNTIRADMIIVDEASMIDLVLLEKLFEAIDERTSIVMLGDRNQLPSVEAGAVLAHLIPDEENPAGKVKRRLVLLRDSYRSEPMIRETAREINNQNYGVIDSIPELDLSQGLSLEGIRRIRPGKTGQPYYKELHRLLDFWVEHSYFKQDKKAGSFRTLVDRACDHVLDPADPELAACVEDIFSYLDEARILSPVKSGISGASGINSYIAGRIGSALDPLGGGKIFSGAPIIITKNDYARELYNGEVGVILRGNDGRYYGLFRRMDGFSAFPAEALPPFELSYAITVHKSQGSEYGRVLFIIPDGLNENLLTREILYTGITRAKKLALLYSSTDMLARAIRNRVERQSGINLSEPEKPFRERFI